MVAEAFRGTLKYNVYRQVGNKVVKQVKSKALTFSDVAGQFAKDSTTNREDFSENGVVELKNIVLIPGASGGAGVDTANLSITVNGSEIGYTLVNSELIPDNNKKDFSDPILIEELNVPIQILQKA